MISKQIFSVNFMFLCSLTEELCRKEESDKTDCNFNFGHECIYMYLYNYLSFICTEIFRMSMLQLCFPCDQISGKCGSHFRRQNMTVWRNYFNKMYSCVFCQLRTPSKFALLFFFTCRFREGLLPDLSDNGLMNSNIFK